MQQSLDGSRLMLEGIGRLEAHPPTSPTGLTLNDGSKAVYDATADNVERIFDHAERRLDKVEEAIKLARQTVISKRAQLKSALHEYVLSLQMVETCTLEMHKQIEAVLVASEQL